jgi:hypothetical protein
MSKSGVLTRRDCRSSWQSSDDAVGYPLKSGVDGGDSVGVTVAVVEALLLFSKTLETVLMVLNIDVVGLEWIHFMSHSYAELLKEPSSKRTLSSNMRSPFGMQESINKVAG